MKFDSVEFTLAGHWLSPLFNGDYTGLSDSETQQLAEFIARETNGLPAGHWAGAKMTASDSRVTRLAACWRIVTACGTVTR